MLLDGGGWGEYWGLQYERVVGELAHTVINIWESHDIKSFTNFRRKKGSSLSTLINDHTNSSYLYIGHVKTYRNI